jgi:hypothetical protein
MRHAVAIENIEEMRRREGIEDVELRKAIRGLAVGDSVKLTFLTGVTPNSGETLRVRITRIEGEAFRGKLSSSPVSVTLANLQAGSAIAFNAAHIHSLVKGEPIHEH